MGCDAEASGYKKRNSFNVVIVCEMLKLIFISVFEFAIPIAGTNISEVDKLLKATPRFVLFLTK